MKNLLLILLLFFVSPMEGIGQACNYGGTNDASELCSFYQGNQFSSDDNADKSLDRILSAMGLSKRFVLTQCSEISNCIATSYKGIRYILYDKDFMDEINNNNNSWSNLSILAHEIGHHVNGHSLDIIVYSSETVEPPTLSESRTMELEADEFSGHVMYRLGATLNEAQQAILSLPKLYDDSYSTHPSTDKRLKAIEKGYNNAKGNMNTNIVYTNVSDEEAQEYYYKGNEYKKENKFQLAYDNYKKAILFNPSFGAAYWYLGLVSDNLEKHQEGINYYSTAIELGYNEEYHGTYWNRSLLFDHLKQYELAIADLRRAVEFSKTDDDKIKYKTKIGRIFQFGLKDYQKAYGVYNSLLKEFPKNYSLYYWKGRAGKQIGWDMCDEFKKGCSYITDSESKKNYCCKQYKEECITTGVISGNCKNGYGVYVYSDGDRYEGDWKNGNKHGQGTYTWINGDEYVGEWKDNKRNGQGTYTFNSGAMYIGKTWKDSKKHGKMTYISSAGKETKQKWKNGKKIK